MPSDEIEIAFHKVKQLVRRMLDGESLRNETLSALFKLNNEVGKAGRTSQKAMQGLIPLQQHVNAITVGVKNSDSKMMRESVVSAEQILGKLLRSSDNKVVEK